MFSEIERTFKRLTISWMFISILQISLIIVNVIGYLKFNNHYMNWMVSVPSNGIIISFFILMCLINSWKIFSIRKELYEGHEYMSHLEEDEEYLNRIAGFRRKLLKTTLLNFILLSFLIPFVGLMLEIGSKKRLKELELSGYEREIEFKETLERIFR